MTPVPSAFSIRRNDRPIVLEVDGAHPTRRRCEEDHREPDPMASVTFVEIAKDMTTRLQTEAALVAHPARWYGMKETQSVILERLIRALARAVLVGRRGYTNDELARVLLCSVEKSIDDLEIDGTLRLRILANAYVGISVALQALHGTATEHAAASGPE